MRVEKIGEPIRVLAVFSGGSAEPIRFRWAGRSYRIQTINGQWVDRQGDAYSLHYSVQVGDETYYLHFDSSEVQWWLDELVLDG